MSGSKFRSDFSFQVSEDILPLGEFKAQLSEKLRELKGRSRPLVVTQNGRPAAVVMSPEAFDRLTEQRRFLEAVNEGLEDLAKGRTLSHEEVLSRLEARYGAAEDKK
jgi:prevent-host-death family protein